MSRDANEAIIAQLTNQLATEREADVATKAMLKGLRTKLASLDPWSVVECFHGLDPSPLQLHEDAAKAVVALVLDVVDGLSIETRIPRHHERVRALETTYGAECGRETRG